MNMLDLIDRQREYYDSGVTKTYAFRIQALKKLREAILYYEEEIYDAVKTDLNKSRLETYLTEIHFVIAEIKQVERRLKRWMRPKRVKSGILNFPSRAFIKPDPYGVVTIIAPWNYPFQLLFSPLVGAIAGGNCAIIKPSEISEATEEVSIKIVERAFNREYISIISGGVDVTSELLACKTDYIFFTGSTMVGKIVATAAAKFLTPMTLELGGKSPCIVDKNCNLPRSVKRIVWGKLLNGGQTCIAPDYLYIHKDIKDQFVNLFRKYAREFYGEDPMTHDHYCKIINSRHYHRLTTLLEDGDILYGGGTHKKDLKIHPTLIENCPDDSPIMTDEIFGPIMPIKVFSDIKEVPPFIRSTGKPLALYIFSRDRERIKYILEHTTSGGVSVNDVISHIVSHDLPFGGVGESGTGAYHGYESFNTFTHSKGVLYKGKLDYSIKFAPYRGTRAIIKSLKTLFT